MKKGFTLIELMIVVILFTILAGFVSWVYVVGLKSWSTSRDRSEIRQDANLALERIVRDISQTNSITAAAADEITFVADVDEDGSDETVTFDVSDNELRRTVGGITTALAPNVQSFSLSYRDLNNVLMTLPQDVASQAKRDNIRVIIISLTLNRGDETFTLSSSVYARNQGYEE